MILSVGYGKNQRGDVRYNFGPVNREGGERRLNVAITRAKRRLTVVSSFSWNEMEPERCVGAGPKLLRQYLQFAESGGENLGDNIIDKPALNPFEVDVRDTLTQHGLTLTPQYGCSGYYIDFAVKDPDHPGRYLLAVECDGASYHSCESARDRDRLRQEQLERLGWTFHRIWSTEWFYQKESAIAGVLAAYQRALNPVVSQGVSEDPAVTVEPAYAVVVPAGASPRSGSRPPVMRRADIGSYTTRELVRLVQWIESDEVLRTEDELLAEVMRELGFERRGKQIVSIVIGAIHRAREANLA